MLLDNEWVPPGEPERRVRREQERGEAQAKRERHAERLRKVDFKFGSEGTSQPVYDTPLGRIVHGLGRDR